MGNSPTALQSALIQFPHKNKQQWLQFTNPTQTIEAWTAKELQQCFEQIENAQKNGLWAVGFVSYHAGNALDPACKAHQEPNIPLASFGIFERAIPTDNPFPNKAASLQTTWQTDATYAEYEKAVHKIKTHIANGETYQVNYTIRQETPFVQDPFQLFQNMCQAQQSKHCAYLELAKYTICSASPELFFSKNGDHITTKPMKGTRPRHPLSPVDLETQRELETAPKDRAENAMIVDMARNDLGRIADTGSVTVPELYNIETYPTVHQLTSTVTAQTTATLYETFSALFPAASITGAPKYETSRIIKTLETTPRGIYTGTIGALSPAGTTAFNVAIRTAWVDKQKQHATYGVGSGIVWDSDPHEEWQEVLDKTRVLDTPTPKISTMKQLNSQANSAHKLLESIRFDPCTGFALLDYHLERLKDNADYFSYPANLEAIETQLATLAPDHRCVIRLLVVSDGSFVHQIRPFPKQHTTTPIKTILDTQPIDENNPFLYFKTTNRVVYEDAKKRHPGYTDVLLWNSKEELTESTIANLVFRKDDIYYTPPIRCGLLGGTLRKKLLDDGVLKEKVLTRKKLKDIDELFLINSVRGWTKITVTEPN